MPSPPLGESWQGDKERQRAVGAQPPGTHPHPILTHTVSVQLLLVHAWPVAHLPRPRVLLATCERHSCAPPGLSLPRLLRVWVNWTWGAPVGGSWPVQTSPTWESLGRGWLWRPLIPNRLRQLRIPSDARRERDFQDWMTMI